ncbi:MAG: type II secretion system F family protein [Candidatus Jorgensenbacteria bacterium]
MRFRYIASQADGRIVESDLDAKDVPEVLAYLQGNNLTPVSVIPIEKSQGLKLFQSKITIVDQIFLSKYLSLMLKIGTSLLEAINVLIADFKKPAMKDVLLEIKSSLEAGKPFYTTFARRERTFSPVYVNLVRAGEASGNLEKVFEDLTDSLSKQKELNDQVKSALIYPILLLGGSVLILAFLIIYALPKISKVFVEGGFEPPLFSRIVFQVGAFLSSNGLYILGFLVAVVAVSIFGYRTSASFKRFVVSVVTEIPLIRDVIRKIGLQRFASTLSALIKAGVSITEGLEITAQAVGNPALREALIRIDREGLAKGLTVGEAFRRESVFPQTVTNLMAISERAGHLEEVLGTLSEFYIKEIDASVKSLVSVLEPVLLLFIGGVIGVIALAIIIPIYQLTTQF